MNKLNKTRQQGTRTLIAITVIAVAVYIGFEPLIKFVPDGVAKSVISASFGAIFVIIVYGIIGVLCVMIFQVVFQKLILL